MQKKIDVNYEIMLDFLKNKAEERKKKTKNHAGLESIVRTVELNQRGLYSREIVKLVEEGRLERIKQGYYRMTEFSQNDSEAALISTLYPDGVLCMTTALFYYGYSDRTPMMWDIAINRNTSKARFNIDYPSIKPYYVEKTHLEYGVSEIQYDSYSLKILDKDRLICECIKHENKMDREIVNKAIQRYIVDNEKNMKHLLEYAVKRNIQNKVREKIGVWL